MPFIRMRGPSRIRRVGRRRAKPIVRRARRALIGRPRAQIYNFKRKIFYENWQTITTAGGATGNGLDFFFSSLPGVTDFTNLYDMYMIKKVVVKLIPKVTQHNLEGGVTTGNADLPQVHSVLDYDDVSTPTSVNDLVQYQNHKMTRGNQVHTRVLVPKVEVTTNAANAPKAFQWLDCDNTVVSHKGIKWWFNAPQSAGTSIYYDLMVTYYFSCKSVV